MRSITKPTLEDINNIIASSNMANSDVDYYKPFFNNSETTELPKIQNNYKNKIKEQRRQ